MPAYDYIPGPDEAFRTWAEAFSSGISANGAFMLTRASRIDPGGCRRLRLSPCDREQRIHPHPPDHHRKDDSRSICESLCRQYAILIKENTGIADEDKIAIGVRPINPNREPVDCPQTSPLISIIGATPGSQIIRFADSTTPDSKAKPFGASELQLFVAIGTEETAPLSDAQFYAKVTRNPVAVEFAEGDDGKIATYYARWASVRGEVGPWSLPVSMVIAAERRRSAQG